VASPLIDGSASVCLDGSEIRRLSVADLRKSPALGGGCVEVKDEKDFKHKPTPAASQGSFTPHYTSTQSIAIAS